MRLKEQEPEHIAFLGFSGANGSCMGECIEEAESDWPRPDTKCNHPGIHSAAHGAGACREIVVARLAPFVAREYLEVRSLQQGVVVVQEADLLLIKVPFRQGCITVTSLWSAASLNRLVHTDTSDQGGTHRHLRPLSASLSVQGDH